MEVRGELPGRSAREHGVANPCGNLFTVSCVATRNGAVAVSHTVVLDLLVVLDRHVGGWRFVVGRRCRRSSFCAVEDFTKCCALASGRKTRVIPYTSKLGKESR